MIPTILPSSNEDEWDTMCRPLDYDFSPLPWQTGCWHWHVSSNMPFASAQVSLQYFFPSRDTQLQAGCSHLDVGFMEAPFVETRTSLQADPWCGEHAHHVTRLQNLARGARLIRTLQQHHASRSHNLFPFCSLL